MMRTSIKTCSLAASIIFLAYVFITSGLDGVWLADFSTLQGGHVGVCGYIVAFVVGGFCITLFRMFAPLALYDEGQFRHGLYAIYQLPIMLCIALLAATVVFLVTRRKSLAILWLIGSYSVAGVITNDLARFITIDHSHDFPIMRAINGLDWQSKPTVDEVIRVLGAPIDQRQFGSEDPLLPKEVRESIKRWNRHQVLILAYHETETFDRQYTYYVFCDPETRVPFSYCATPGPIKAEEWPNQLPDDTARKLVDP